tara:strand:- start:419 stop:769 length:351 start_codon:yes stop_codon:yes gene_type:complete
MKNNFKIKNTFEKRKLEASNIIQKYPEKIPIIVQKYYTSELPEIDKSKYLVPKDMTMSQFMFTIRKRIQLESNQALFIWINNGLVTSSKTMMEIYSENKDEDGFLYIDYTNENTFG